MPYFNDYSEVMKATAELWPDKRDWWLKLYAWTTANGEPIYYVARFDPPKNSSEGKFIRPFYLRDGRYTVGKPNIEKGKAPLFGIYQLLSDPHPGPICIVEGEKSTLALIAAGVNAVTSGSASSAANADWLVIAGAAPDPTDPRIIVWPDNDDPGIKYAHEVTRQLRKLGRGVKWVDVARLNLKPGGDAVDWLEANPGAGTLEFQCGLNFTDPPMEKSAEAESADAYQLESIADITREPVRWLWHGQMARGNVSIICGEPGIGKSQLTLLLAAITTRSGFFPGCIHPCDGGRVLLISAEDSISQTVSQRLEAAGADLKKCMVMKSTDFDLQNGLARLDLTLKAAGDVALVVIDPVSAYLGTIDEYKNAEVRGMLAKLYELAQARNVAIMLVSHPNKSAMKNLGKITGSIAFGAAVRSAFMVEKSENDPRLRKMYTLKNNLGADTFEKTYIIFPVTLDDGSQTTRIEWEA